VSASTSASTFLKSGAPSYYNLS